MLNEIFHTVFNLSLIGSVMIIGIFLIRGLSLKKRWLKSSLLVLLWMVSLFRMMIPISIPLSAGNSFPGAFGIGWPTVEQQHLSLQEAEKAWNQEAAPGKKQGQFAGIEQSDHKVWPDSPAEASGGESNAAAGLEGQAIKSDKGILNGNNHMTIYDIIPVIWLAGAALMAAVFLSVWLFTVRRGKNTTEVSYAGWQAIKSIVGTNRDIPLKRTREGSVKQGPEARTPYVSGVFCPVIILPAWMDYHQNEHMDHILLHELIHIRHWDNLKKAVAAAALCLHWFNPFFWLCWILFQRDLECSCDEKVVELLGNQGRKRYAESLYEFACGAQNILLCHFSSPGKTAVHQRIKRILAGSQKLSLTGILSLGIAFLLLITGCAVSPSSAVSKAPAESFVVYAAPDGLYQAGLDGSGAEMIYQGVGLSNPVLSQKGDMVMFRQDKRVATQGKALPDESALYVYHFGLKKGIPLKETSFSYCAGPDNTFLLATPSDNLLKAEFQTVQRGGSHDLEYSIEDISVWPEAVDRHPNIIISYDHLKCSPDYKYLAYSTYAQDYREPSESGFQVHPAYYNGGLYVLELQTGKAVMAVPAQPATAENLGADPVPGPWSRDSKTLTIWDKPMSASLSADGVSLFFYHGDTGLKTGYGKTALAYDENVSFSGQGTAAVLTGIGREMFYGKEIDLITDYSGAQAKVDTLDTITQKGLIPAMPLLSKDGGTLYFAAVNSEDVKNYENAYPLKRQLYSVQPGKTGEIRQITSDPNYRNESPVLLKDEERLVFGRASAEAYDGKMEIWIVNLQSGEETRLAGWTEPEPTDVWMSYKYDDFYGRGDWNGIFAVYDE